MVTNRSDGFSALVRALVVLADAPRGMATSKEIAEAIRSHPVIVRRMLAAVRSTGLVESRRGPHGGWALAKDPKSVRLSDLYAEAPPAGTTAIDRVLADAEAAYLARLHDRTLADLQERK
ncbi:MAG TPA: Rrf2 family transcriptional regulator [Methylomirabilota bacterium]|nr:Rrf2 family transcriptional regulator [Methylomirabilota bacterium]